MCLVPQASWHISADYGSVYFSQYLFQILSPTSLSLKLCYLQNDSISFYIFICCFLATLFSSDRCFPPHHSCPMVLACSVQLSSGVFIKVLGKGLDRNDYEFGNKEVISETEICNYNIFEDMLGKMYFLGTFKSKSFWPHIPMSHSLHSITAGICLLFCFLPTQVQMEFLL